MSQVVLGIRSLVFKLAIFFVMAALLAWALGGTLFPRPVIVPPHPTVAFADAQWGWEAEVTVATPRAITWRLVSEASGTRTVRLDGPFEAVAGPVVAGGMLVVGVEDLESGGARRWRLASFRGSENPTWAAMPDRLAVEQQLARAVAGLPIQDISTVVAERRRVIDPTQGP